MINIAKILKNCPKGTKLYSPLLGEVEFAEVMDTDYVPIRVICGTIGERFDEFGRYKGNEYPNAECLLFPSKDYRTWQGWTPDIVPKFKVGDKLKRVGESWSDCYYVSAVDDKNMKYTIKWWEDGFECAKDIPFELQDDYYINHKFKVGDWITNGLCTIQISSIGYENDASCMMYYHNNNTIGGDVESIDKQYHLWNITDAKDGDVLALNGKPFIYSNKYGKNYCYIDDCGQFRANFNLVLEGNCVCPATKQERDWLFSKMREVGYKWDVDKKELCKVIKPKYKVGDRVIYKENVRTITRIVENYYELDGWTASCYIEDQDKLLSPAPKFNVGDTVKSGSFWARIKSIDIENRRYICDFDNVIYFENQDAWNIVEIFENEHYDISNFKALDPVLVRNHDGELWVVSHFSNYFKDYCRPFVCENRELWSQCIPFKNNEILNGTRKKPDKKYINW